MQTKYLSHLEEDEKRKVWLFAECTARKQLQEGACTVLFTEENGILENNIGCQNLGCRVLIGFKCF